MEVKKKLNSDNFLFFERPNKHQYFLDIAKLVSTRSHDAQTQHGCVLVKDGRIISTGYNGFIAGSNDNDYPNCRPTDKNNQWYDSKYNFILHSETNAIISAAKAGINISEAILYCTGHPCLECTKQLIQAGITEWYLGSISHKESDDARNTREFLIHAHNVKITILKD